MKVITRILVLVFFIPFLGLSQQDSPLIKKLDSLGVKEDSLNNAHKNRISDDQYEHAKLDVRTYFTLLADDFKQLTVLPFHSPKKDWLKVGGFALLAGGVAMLNKPINKFTVKLHDENKAVANVSKYVTRFGGPYEIYALAGFYTYGLLFKTEKEKTTTALATQAYITAGVITTVAKYLTGEQRPYYTDPNYNKKGPIFHGPFYPFKKNVDLHSYSSFPSGHTTAAFAAATVYALEYRDNPLIPIISYSAATLIGLSRLTENKHWASDVFVGALLGYLNGKQVVNNFHRYSGLKLGKGGHEPVSFNLQYNNKQFLSALIYKF